MSHKEEFWHKTIGEGWYNFYPNLWNSTYMEKVMTYISARYDKATVFPEMNNLFRAFKLCPYDKFKVLILGQDPYSDGSCTGLAFANDENNTRISKSLKKIIDCVERDIYSGFKVSVDITLEDWANQGVLLLNSSLTFEKYKGGHQGIWRDFINEFLTKINEIHGSHICLWGNNARSFKYRLEPKSVYIYEAVHPSYAARQNIDWNCNHFKQINEQIIKQNGKEEIIIW